MDPDEVCVMELRNRSITKYNNIVLVGLNKLFDDAIPRSTRSNGNGSQKNIRRDAAGDSEDPPIDFEAQALDTSEHDDHEQEHDDHEQEQDDPEQKQDDPEQEPAAALNTSIEDPPSSHQSDALLLIEEATLRLRETFALAELDERRQEMLQKARSASEAARKEAVDRSASLAERIRQEMDETATRKAVKSIAGHIDDVWNGRYDSWRYSAFKKGGASRRALLYRMITEPFTGAQIKWILQEIEYLHMPTEPERREHQDFVWKVVLAETLIKLYMEKFHLDKATAERSIADTPIEDNDDHLWTKAKRKGKSDLASKS